MRPDLPIAVALDLHTNLTADMVDNATVLAGYKTYPHIDIYKTGMRAGTLPFVRIGRSVRFYADAVRAALEK